MPVENDIQILERIRLDGKIEKLIAASRDDNIVVTWDNKDMTLTAAIQEIIQLITARTSPSQARTIAAEEVAKLVNGAPETLDTLKEIADALAESEGTIQGLIDLLGNKVDKIPGMGLSDENFTPEFKNILLSEVIKKSNIDSSLNLNSSNPIANSAVALAIQNLQVLASPIQNGLMSKEDKSKFDKLNKIWVEEVPPTNMIDGDIFIQFVGD